MGRLWVEHLPERQRPIGTEYYPRVKNERTIKNRIRHAREHIKDLDAEKVTYQEEISELQQELYDLRVEEANATQ